MENAYKNLTGNLKERDHLEDGRMVEWIILQYFLKRLGGRV
jgi:hypothetical protein